MSKKGFFGFLNIGGGTSTEEDELQREFARSQADKNKATISTEPAPIAKSGRSLERDRVMSDLPEDDASQSKITDEMKNFMFEKLDEILRLSQFNCEVSVSVEDPDLLLLEISTEEDKGRIIGRDGSTINALQTLLKAIFFQKYDDGVRLLVDTGGYHRKRLEQALEKAQRAAEDLSQDAPKKELQAMSASERRAIHVLFKEDSNVNSYSVGQGRDRRVVLELSA